MPTRYFSTDANGDYGLTRGGVANDSTIADAAPGSRDYNGPGGRWCTAGVPTRLDWEATASGPELSAPAIGSATLPASTTTQAITIGLGASVYKRIACSAPCS